MKRQLRGAALTILKSCGAFSLVRDSGWRRHKLLILCYHGVALEDENQWRPFLYINTQQLERRLDVLRDGEYAVLPLVEALERLLGNDLPPKSVALTFDDGTYDFYKLVWPRLKSYGFPATVYLTTYYSELRRPIFRLVCSYLLWKARDVPGIDLRQFGTDLRVELSSAENREKVVNQLDAWAHSKDFSGEQKDQMAASLAKRLGIDYQELRAKRILQLMNIDEVKELAAEGVDFQLHTHRHRAPLSEELFRQEIRDNRLRIVDAIGGERRHFCYPSGAYRPEFLGWLAKEEIVSATTCDTGFATPETNPLLLPRFVDTTGRTDLEFESWVGGIGHFLSTRKRARLAVALD